MTGLVISGLARVGLARNVVRIPSERQNNWCSDPLVADGVHGKARVAEVLARTG